MGITSTPGLHTTAGQRGGQGQDTAAFPDTRGKRWAESPACMLFSTGSTGPGASLAWGRAEMAGVDVALESGRGPRFRDLRPVGGDGAWSPVRLAGRSSAGPGVSTGGRGLVRGQGGTQGLRTCRGEGRDLGRRPRCHLLDPSDMARGQALHALGMRPPEALLAVEIAVLPPNTHRGQRGTRATKGPLALLTRHGAAKKGPSQPPRVPVTSLAPERTPQGLLTSGAGRSPGPSLISVPKTPRPARSAPPRPRALRSSGLCGPSVHLTCQVPSLFSI